MKIDLLVEGDDLEGAVERLAECFSASGISTADFLRVFGYEVMIAPDGELCPIIDAPAVVYPDGRAYTKHGVVYRDEYD